MKFNILSVVTSLIFFIIDHYILHKFQIISDEKHECKCANTWHVARISKLIIFIMIAELTILIIAPFILDKFAFLRTMEIGLLVFSIVTFCVGLYYIYLLGIYIKDVSTAECECREKSFHNTLIYYTSFRILVILANIALIVFIGKKISSKISVIPTGEIIKLKKEIL